MSGTFYEEPFIYWTICSVFRPRRLHDRPRLQTKNSNSLDHPQIEYSNCNGELAFFALVRTGWLHAGREDESP